MNTLIHLWRGSDHTADQAILDTPMHPARYYFGPVYRFGDHSTEWIPADNATRRYHATLTEARGAAVMAGFDILPITPRLSDTERVADFIFTTKATDYCGAYPWRRLQRRMDPHRRD